jgi:hypothetical protein
VRQKPVAAASVRRFPLADIAICGVIFIATILVYSETSRYEFSSYDDPEYVTENADVRTGISAASFRAAFTSPAVGNWIPVAVLSHALDVQLFGLDAGAHHMVSVLLHSVSAILLFLFLRRATGARYPSAFVAAIFALHPLHVESVAWIAERKDVLSALFAFAALYVYARYVEAPNGRRYAAVAVLFALGLMAKPMLVTFPLLLLLLDFWPFRRTFSSRLIVEKLPLLALSAADSVATYFVQGTAVQTIPLAVRLRAALESVVVYVGQLFWPVNLAVFYPYHGVAMWQALLYALVIAAVCGLVVWRWRSQPYLATGWFWYLGTLVPVIGIVQVGAQARADRYTYIPSVGITILLAWAAADLAARRAAWKAPLTAAAAIACVACSVVTAHQTTYWRNSGTLYQRAIDATKDNYIAHNGLAIYLAQTGRPGEAIPHFEAALRLVPRDAGIHNSVGILYANIEGGQRKAIEHFEAAVRLDPEYMEAQYNLGLALSQVRGREAEALAHFEAAQRLRPSVTVAKAIERLRAEHPELAK